jgi:predicted O-linked N-acetylglucosamine transferase (SPINDLY family)
MSSPGPLAQPARWSEFEAAAAGFTVIEGTNLRMIAERVAALDLDILIDLNGIQQPGSRVGALAWRPAPVQMTWAGSPTVCGLRALDYQILDRWLAPETGSDSAAGMGWAPLEMEESWISIGAFPDAPVADELPSERVGHVTFASMLTPDKFHPAMLADWAEVLRRVPGARLLLSRPDYAYEATRAHIRRWFADQGLDERVDFRFRLEEGQTHLDIYRDVDIALDAYPVGGGVTVAEALWMGVPATTLTGPLVQHRVGLSVLAAAGLEDLAADSHAGLVDVTVALAEDAARRRALRTTLRARLRASSLIDTDRFAAQFAHRMEDVAARHGVGPHAAA